VDLRPYQEDCVSSVLEKLREFRSTIAVLATGLGKTVIFSHVGKLWPTGRVLCLAHREELIFQAAEKLEKVTGKRPDVEMAEHRADHTGLFTDSRFVVASVQSLCQAGRLSRFNPDDFGLVVVDEAHHCVPANKTYAKILRHFLQNDRLRLFGVTATADRADGKAMGAYFESVAFEYGILKGINGGWLCPIDQQYVTVEGLDLRKVRTSGGDLNGADMEQIFLEEKMLHRVVTPTVEAAGDEPTLIFTVSVAHAEKTAEILNRHRLDCAVCLHGGTPKDERRKKLAEFAGRKFQYLVGCGLFLEGFDCPQISVVVMARPTKSRALYTQAVGRGTRLAPGKKRLLVLDFVGNSGKHKLVSTADILAGQASREAVERATASAKKKGGPADMRQELFEAEAQIADERKRAEELAARKERERVVAEAKWRSENVDPFDSFDTQSGEAANYRHVKPPSEGMRRLLEKHGRWREAMTHAEAGRAIDRLKQEWSGQACTPKQAHALRRFGEVANVTKNKAGVLLDLATARGWQPRDYRLTKDRWSLRRLNDGTYAPVVNDTQAGKVQLSRTFRSEQDCRFFIQSVVEPDGERVGAA
jgi:superfamily II DNA or RNA helicase